MSTTSGGDSSSYLNIIPTPDVRVVKGYDDGPNIKPYVRSSNYVLYKSFGDELPEGFVDYDLDSEDEEFLNKLNGSSSKKVLTETKFESLMDRLERESARGDGYSDKDNLPSFAQMEKAITGGGVSKNVLQAVYNHWYRRRQSLNLPLLVRYLVSQHCNRILYIR